VISVLPIVQILKFYPQKYQREVIDSTMRSPWECLRDPNGQIHHQKFSQIGICGGHKLGRLPSTFLRHIRIFEHREWGKNYRFDQTNYVGFFLLVEIQIFVKRKFIPTETIFLLLHSVIKLA